MIRLIKYVAMVRLCLAFFLCTAFAASAAVTPFPGVTPQTAEVWDYFPEPLRFKVTDDTGAPVGGATISWGLPYLTGMDPHGNDVCEFELGYFCHSTSDASGIVDLGKFRNIYPSVEQINVYARAGARDLGFATVTLTAVPRRLPTTFVVVTGDGQQARIGTRYPQPFVVRAVRSNGQPDTSIRVTFDASSSSPGNGSFFGAATTDVSPNEDGYVTSPLFTAGSGVGPGTVSIRAFDESSGQDVAPRMISFTNTAQDPPRSPIPGPPAASVQDMWWSSSENGWGVSIVQHGRDLFSVIYVYDAAGEPTWYVMPAGIWEAGVGGPAFTGPIYSPRSAPYFAYDTASFAPGASIGSASLMFTGSDAAVLRLQLDSGNTVVKNLVRQDFSTDRLSPLPGVADMWWGGPRQNGWGIAVLEQKGGLFAVWLTYDSAGKPTWFVMPGGEWRNASTYAGSLYRTRGSPWVAGYDASQLRIAASGRYAFYFSGRESATFVYEIDGRLAQIELQRQPF